MALNNVVQKVEIVHISEIEVDPKFNARSAHLVKESSTGGGGDVNEAKGAFVDFCNSIAKDGQDTPVKLRKMPKGSKKPYYLVAGFRRVAALLHNAKLSPGGEAKATVRAEIYDMSDLEARKLNLRENTARDDLGTADTAFGIKALIKLDGKLTQNDIAATLGINQSWAGKLQQIVVGLQGDLLTRWRSLPNPLSSSQMLGIAKLATKEEQEAKFDELSRKGKESTNGAPEKGPDAWVGSKVKEAEKIGAILGTLSKAGAIEIPGDPDMFFVTHIRTLVTFKASAKEEYVALIEAAAQKGFTDAENGVTKQEEVPDAKPGPKKKTAAAKGGEASAKN